ncbi:hypothetical protein KAI32_02995 [Candidatus Pacearchaeota archaeon]|nr:hypothetical protein [Candidatus Pacearchaeota archaeon]
MAESTAELFSGLVSLGAGAYHGYCNAQGIPLEKENLELVLTYGPAVLNATIMGGLIGLGGITRGWRINNTLEATIIGTGIGGIKGGTKTLLGYGIGYLTGYVMK